MFGKKFNTEISRGCELLDKRVGPTWSDRIDLDTLNMECSCRCILGQLYGGYFRGERILFGERLIAPALNHGFNTHTTDYRRLTKEWTKE